MLYEVLEPKLMKKKIDRSWNIVHCEVFNVKFDNDLIGQLKTNTAFVECFYIYTARGKDSQAF